VSPVLLCDVMLSSRLLVEVSVLMEEKSEQKRRRSINHATRRARRACNLNSNSLNSAHSTPDWMLKTPILKTENLGPRETIIAVTVLFIQYICVSMDYLLAGIKYEYSVPPVLS
jgi:hypothetical protein